MTTILTHAWSWWFSGIVIGFIMLYLLYFGGSFGFSANLRTICSMSGAGKNVKFFDFNWKSQIWNLIFLIGGLTGGFISSHYMYDGKTANISQNTIHDLQKLGFSAPDEIQPKELFSREAVFSLKGFFLLAVGGLMVGFGARYAGGCTSGHAISGISDLQIPSIIAVVGFFIGGLIMTHILFPVIF